MGSSVDHGALITHLEPAADSLDRLPPELKSEIVKCASFGAEKEATLASLRLLNWEFYYYATPLFFEVS